jgi:hypothetical protein
VDVDVESEVEVEMEEEAAEDEKDEKEGNEIPVDAVGRLDVAMEEAEDGRSDSMITGGASVNAVDGSCADIAEVVVSGSLLILKECVTFVTPIGGKVVV